MNAFSKGFFELAAAQNPKPKTVAIVAADAEFARSRPTAPRENAKTHGFKIVYDKTYPPSTTDFMPIMRAVQAANPDIVFVAAYPPDTVGIVRAANEIGFKPKMFGGTLIGLLVTPIKMQLGPLITASSSTRASARAELQFPRHRRCDQALSGQGAGRGDRSARLSASRRSATPPARSWRRR